MIRSRLEVVGAVVLLTFVLQGLLWLQSAMSILSGSSTSQMTDLVLQIYYVTEWVQLVSLSIIYHHNAKLQRCCQSRLTRDFSMLSSFRSGSKDSNNDADFMTETATMAEMSILQATESQPQEGKPGLHINDDSPLSSQHKLLEAETAELDAAIEDESELVSTNEMDTDLVPPAAADIIELSTLETNAEPSETAVEGSPSLEVGPDNTLDL